MIPVGSHPREHFQGNMEAEELQWLNSVEQVCTSLYRPRKITPGILPLLLFYQKEADNVEGVQREQHKMIKGQKGKGLSM